MISNDLYFFPLFRFNSVELVFSKIEYDNSFFVSIIYLHVLVYFKYSIIIF